MTNGLKTSRLSRRTFLKAGAATAVAAGLNIPLLASVTQATGSPDAVPNSTLLDSGWEFYRGPLDPRFQVWHSEQLVTWQAVTLPHCFNAYDACDPDTPAYRGPGWYRTHLTVANPYPHGRTLLHFEAAGQRAEIYVGDQLAGSHSGGYDEFLVDVTELVGKLPAGSPVPLAVLCDNSRDIERMPSDLSDFTLYGGLYRHAHLVYLPAVALEALHTRVAWGPGQAAARASVTVRLYMPEAAAGTTPQTAAGAIAQNAAGIPPATASGNVNLRLTISDPQGKTIFMRTLDRAPWQGETELAAVDLPAPTLWSPATPSLYRCELTLTSGGTSITTAHRFGVRHTRFEEHGPFFLNGERLPIRGTHRHEDGTGYAAAEPEDLVRQEMRMMKQMGANFVRLAHYQQSRLVLELCDELGIMVWEELPWCRSGVGSELFQQRGRAQLTAMIDQHRNHPAVVIWGLGNEDDWPGELNGKDHQAIRDYMTGLRDLGHQLDPTRLTGLRRCDFARDIPDVYSPSIWAGWYSGSYTEYRKALEKARYTVPHLLHVEWGADSHAGRHAEDVDPVMAKLPLGQGTAETGFDYKMTGGVTHASKDGEWSETYACALFDWYLKTLEEVPWLTGAVQWIFKDFTTPLRVENPVPRVNQKGVLTRDLTPKEGYYVFQSYWAEEPMLRVYGHDWPIRWGNAGQPRRVHVHSNCAEVELFLNGKSVGVRKRDSQDFPSAGLRWDVVFAPGKNDLRAEAHSKGATLTDRCEFLYQTEAWGKPVALKLADVSSVADVAAVEATLHDAASVRCLDSRAWVRFSLAGEGKLMDNLGTPTGSRLVQMYNGRARISLTHAEAVVAAVHSDGIEPAFLSLPGR